MSTALDVITEAMREIGAVFLDEAPTGSEVQTCLLRFNWMLDVWSANNLMVRAEVQGHFPLVAAKSAYTIGTGGDYVSSKPLDILRAFVRDSNNLDYPVGVITRDEYEAMEDKAFTSSRPDRLYFDLGLSQQSSQLGTINLYPIPDNSGPYTLYFDQLVALSEISNFTDPITFEGPYFEALLYGLAERIWGLFHDDGKPVKPDLARNARRSKKVIENLNSRMVVMRTDVPSVKPATFNIYTQDYE